MFTTYERKHFDCPKNSFFGLSKLHLLFTNELMGLVIESKSIILARSNSWTNLVGLSNQVKLLNLLVDDQLQSAEVLSDSYVCQARKCYSFAQIIYLLPSQIREPYYSEWVTTKSDVHCQSQTSWHNSFRFWAHIVRNLVWSLHWTFATANRTLTSVIFITNSELILKI